MYTFDKLREKLGIRDTAYELKYGLKRFCSISHTRELDLPQWVATLEFMEENYNYCTTRTMLARLKQAI